jgi:feruloyl esterase
LEHCGGAGPAPTGLLAAILAWVEDGKAPETLLATRRDPSGAVTRSRRLCAYPFVAKYKGRGEHGRSRQFRAQQGSSDVFA